MEGGYVSSTGCVKQVILTELNLFLITFGKRNLWASNTARASISNAPEVSERFAGPASDGRLNASGL